MPTPDTLDALNDSPVLNLEALLTKTAERLLDGRQGRVPARLVDSIRYSLLAPGKRIRPRLALACGRMAGLPPQASISAALALEMIHCYTLIHDDLPCMDDDDIRRGRPSNHRQFDEATALLAGSALASMALDSLLEAQAHVQPQHLITAIRRLNWAMGPHGVLGGQSAEFQLTAQSTLDDLREMHAQKTGALFYAAVLVPADLAGVDLQTTRGRALSVFARELGLAFQVVDDLEDSEQDFVAAPAKSENDKPSGATSPGNILHYLSENEARLLTLDSLNRAIHDLVLAWDESAKPLALIASEVAKKLTPLEKVK